MHTSLFGLRTPQPDERLRQLKREAMPIVMLLTITGLFETAGGLAILFGEAVEPTLYFVVGANILIVLFYLAWKRRLHNRHEDRGGSGLGSERDR